MLRDDRSGVARRDGQPRSAISRGGKNRKMGVIAAKIAVITAKMEVIRGHQASDDFWGAAKLQSTEAPITHATPLDDRICRVPADMVGVGDVKDRWSSHRTFYC